MVETHYIYYHVFFKQLVSKYADNVVCPAGLGLVTVCARDIKPLHYTTRRNVYYIKKAHRTYKSYWEQNNQLQIHIYIVWDLSSEDKISQIQWILFGTHHSLDSLFSSN